MGRRSPFPLSNKVGKNSPRMQLCYNFICLILIGLFSFSFLFFVIFWAKMAAVVASLNIRGVCFAQWRGGPDLLLLNPGPSPKETFPKMEIFDQCIHQHRGRAGLMGISEGGTPGWGSCCDGRAPHLPPPPAVKQEPATGGVGTRSPLPGRRLGRQRLRPPRPLPWALTRLPMAWYRQLVSSDSGPARKKGGFADICRTPLITPCRINTHSRANPFRWTHPLTHRSSVTLEIRDRAMRRAIVSLLPKC